MLSQLEEVQLSEGKCPSQEEDEDPATQHQHIIADEVMMEAKAILNVGGQGHPLAIHIDQRIRLQELGGDQTGHRVRIGIDPVEPDPAPQEDG